MQSLVSDDSFVDEFGKNHNGNYAAHVICANIPVTMSANSDKLISDFRNSWCNNWRIPWKSDVIGLRPSNSTWITCINERFDIHFRKSSSIEFWLICWEFLFLFLFTNLDVFCDINKLEAIDYLISRVCFIVIAWIRTVWIWGFFFIRFLLLYFRWHLHLFSY